MSLPAKAFYELFPDKSNPYFFNVKYSGRFNDFNARILMRGKEITFSLSKRWKEIDDEIVLGLYQELLARLFKDKRKTRNIEVYHIFVQNMHICSTRIDSDENLIESYNRVNEKYFYNSIEQPNLIFQGQSRRVLGSYNFHTDTIKITGLLKDAPIEIIDYIMYHELLHKELKFDHTKTRARHHTTEFRRRESEYENFKEMDKRINAFLKSKRKKPWELF